MMQFRHTQIPLANAGKLWELGASYACIHGGACRFEPCVVTAGVRCCVECMKCGSPCPKCGKVRK